jgi:hypothetical protein
MANRFVKPREPRGLAQAAVDRRERFEQLVATHNVLPTVKKRGVDASPGFEKRGNAVVGDFDSRNANGLERFKITGWKRLAVVLSHGGEDYFISAGETRGRNGLFTAVSVRTRNGNRAVVTGDERNAALVVAYRAALATIHAHGTLKPSEERAQNRRRLSAFRTIVEEDLNKLAPNYRPYS